MSNNIFFVFNFSRIKTAFVLLFALVYKMVDTEYSTNNYKSFKTSTAAIIYNTEILRFVSDHLKTKEMFKHAVKHLPFMKRYVPDRYKTQEICDKAILQSGGTSECYKNQNMRNEGCQIIMQMH